MERRLAAILAADVVGYSRLMGADEAGTVAALRALREELFEPKIAEHHGRTVKLMGDGTLVEFASVVDAVNCAVEVQDALKARNAELPEAKRIELRIGVNLGDMIVDGDDLYGDGVNIAARLEGLADHGGICVSAKVFEEARGKVDARFEDLGLETLKNIAEPVHVYRVVPGAGATATAVPIPPENGRRLILGIAVVILLAVSLATAWWVWDRVGSSRSRAKLPDKPSIAVLPFDDLSEEPRQWLGDGMAEDIITDLSKLKGLFIIARNSSFQYRGGDLDMREVGRDLGVAYLLEGSVRRAGDTLRINAQVIDARTGGHVWAERFDGAAGDVFALQDKVTRQVVARLKGVLTAEEIKTLAVRPTKVPEAYDAYLQGGSHMHRRTPEDFAEAKKWLDRALELDPTYPDALGARALLYFSTHQYGWNKEVQIPEMRHKAYVPAALAAEKYPSALAYAAKAEISFTKPDPNGAAAAVNQGLALAPNNPDLLELQAFVAARARQRERAFALIDRAMKIDPMYPASRLQSKGTLHQIFGENEAAVALYNGTLQRTPADWNTNLLRAASLVELGRVEEAKADIEVARRNWPKFWVDFAAPYIAWIRGRAQGEAYVSRLKAAFLLAGAPALPDGIQIRPENLMTKEEQLELWKDGYRQRGICCGGGEWIVDRKENGEAMSYWKGEPMEPSSTILYDDGSYQVVARHWYQQDRLCETYKNPTGSKDTLDAYISICTNGVYPFGVFPLPN